MAKTCGPDKKEVTPDNAGDGIGYESTEIGGQRGMRAIRGKTSGLGAAAIAEIALVVLLPASAGASAGDGTGTMTVSPTYVINNSTGNFLTFTYTAAAGGLSAGDIDLTVPAGWTAPDANGFNPGGTNALCGDSPVTITGS